MSIRRSVLVIVIGVLVAMLSPLAANAQEPAEGVTCTLPESDAEALVILSNYYPGYWWDHTDLTVYVQAHPSATTAQRQAINGAIETWNSVLQECFDGLISLTRVNSRREADIVVHYVPTAGGVVFGGYAICGDHGCPNILVRSDLPSSLDRDPYDPEYLGWVTLHELGHALGLGHATNLLESTDLMGYGWPELGDPVLSQCDVNALAFVFAWALEGSDPYPPAEGPTSATPDRSNGRGARPADVPAGAVLRARSRTPWTAVTPMVAGTLLPVTRSCRATGADPPQRPFPPLGRHDLWRLRHGRVPSSSGAARRCPGGRPDLGEHHQR